MLGGQQRIGDNKKCRRIASDFDCHVDAAPAAAMVDEFVEKTQNTYKHNF